MAKNSSVAHVTFKEAFLPTFLKLKILDWLLWFAFCLTIFCSFQTSRLIYCSLLLSFFKTCDTSFFSCWRFSSFVFFYYVFLVLF